MTGIYWNDKDHFVRRIYFRNDTLRYFRAFVGNENKLVPLGNDRFYMVENPGGVTTVSFTSATPGNPRQMIVVVDDEQQKAATEHGPYVYHALEPASPSPELEDYLGTYYSEDVDYEWVLRITNERLSLWDPITWDEASPLRPVGRDVFRLGWWGFFTFSRDGQGRVVGFAVESASLRNLRFVRR